MQARLALDEMMEMTNSQGGDDLVENLFLAGAAPECRDISEFRGRHKALFAHLLIGMYEITTQVSADAFERLENAVFAMDDATRWNFLEDLEAGAFRVQGVFEDETEARQAWAQLFGEAGVSGLPTVTVVRDEDWRESYREHFQPWTIGRLHWVPLWLQESYPLPEGDHAVWLDPGMAFGTGNHETTRLCVERLLEARSRFEGRRLAAAKVVDAGCGSGILAISAVKLGFGLVSGFDNDAEAVRIAQENAVLNGVEELPFEVADLVSGFAAAPYDIVMANILAVALIEYRERLVASLSDDGVLILSGILAREASSVRDAFGPLRQWRSIETHEMGEWCSVTLS